MSTTALSTLNSRSVAPLRGNGPPAGVGATPHRNSSHASRSGIWVGIFAMSMSFAAFTSALFVREGTPDWGHIALPSALYFNTIFLLASGGSFELARRSFFFGRSARIEPAGAWKGRAWLTLTLLLGCVFCAGQYLVWQELRAQGIYLATNPNSSFFYVLTFVHALHVFAGLLALLYLLGRSMARSLKLRKSFIENTAIYWHFMGAVWVYLFVLCRTKL